jgi:hypothetical protein
VAGTTGRKRWDADDRFVGVADASGFAAAIEELAALARRAGWVAEDPDVHLVPHLTAAAVEGLRLVSYRVRADGVLIVAVQYSPGMGRSEIRLRAWALIGTIAEPAASVCERPDGDTVVFDVVTGIPDGTGPFASHGHSVRLELTPGTTA